MSSEVEGEDVRNSDSEPVAKLMRDPYDWLIALALVGLTPGVGVLLTDLWSRTDLLFAPVLPLFSVFLVWRLAKLEEQTDKQRSVATLVVLGLGVVSAGCAVLAHSAWLCTLGICLITMAWMLERFGKTRWPFLACAILPASLLLLLPLADATDWAFTAERFVARVSGSLLDMLSIPNLVSGDSVELRDGVLSASLVCRWFGSPYLLFALATLYMVVRQKSFLVGLATVASVPLWSILWGVVHLTAGLYLLIKHDVNLLIGMRGTLTQVAVLLLAFLCVLLTQRCVATFLLPFVAFSGTGAELHKFFNRVVYWPNRDPLRGRRSSDVENAHRIGRGRNAMIALGVLALALVAVGGMIILQVASGTFRERMARVSAFADLDQSGIFDQMLPTELLGMQLVDFYERRNLGKPFSDRSFSWVYQRGLDRVRITLRPSHRGYVQLEKEYLTPLSRIGEPSQQSNIEMDEFGRLLLDEVVLLDDLYGRSYLSYAMIGQKGIEPLRTLSTGATGGRKQLQDSLAVQPTLASVAVYVEGAPRLGEEERDQLRDVLLSACVKLSEAQADSAELSN
ncbi:MAG: hypothetical protein Aurels2KO_26980 [Aureliella sp.]